MKIQLGINKSPFNKINKDFVVTKTLNGTMRESLSDYKTTITFNSNIKNVNYAFFNDCYYFVDDISYPATGICEITFSIDVLMTYKDYILGLEIYAERDSVGNPDIPDDNVKLSLQQDVRTIYIDNVDMSEQGGSYVLVTSQDGVNMV